MMIIIFWNPFAIHVLAALPEMTSFDEEYFLDYVLTPIEELPVMHAAAVEKQTLVFHIDNSLIHKSKATIQKLHQRGSKSLLISPTHRILLRQTSFFLVISSKRSRVKNCVCGRLA
jgi:phosphoserine phosphatase